MPEGDSVATSARRLAPVLLCGPLTAVASRWPDKVRGLEGQRVVRLACRGKNLLIDLDDHTTVRVHLKMSGRWSVRPVPSGWGEVSIGFRTGGGQAVCRRAPDVDRLRTDACDLHPALRELGPDLIGLTLTQAGASPLPPPPVEEAVQRARDRGVGRSLHRVLLDQRVAAGLGNVYASELAFVVRAHPLVPLEAVEGRLEQLYATGAEWLRRNSYAGPRTTVPRGRAGALWVVRRHGRPCLRCGTRIRRGRSPPPHPRPVWWCPRCQEGPASSGSADGVR